VTVAVPKTPSSLSYVTATAAPPTRSFAEVFSSIAANIEQIVYGKPEAIELALVCLLAEGHLLVEDVPGVGKTSLAKALAGSIDCTWRRVQFTPDLLPADLVGVSVWQRATETFDFRPGPMFANIVLADEINRASPKTQSALLESMEERQVTADGRTYALPPPFMVIATQNPVEQEGTYRLPESQLDRFLLRLSLGYPTRAAELTILETLGANEAIINLRPVATSEEILQMVRAAKAVHLAPVLKNYLVDLAEMSRRHPSLTLGMSPRATLQLARAVRARAVSQGRDFGTPDDVKALALPVLAHRLLVRHDAALQGVTGESAIDDVLGAVPVPMAPRAAGR
jgi:MoxR-like ATPase